MFISSFFIVKQRSKVTKFFLNLSHNALRFFNAVGSM